MLNSGHVPPLLEVRFFYLQSNYSRANLMLIQKIVNQLFRPNFRCLKEGWQFIERGNIFMDHKLQVKDLTHIGIFLVIYYILICICSMAGVLTAMAMKSALIAWIFFALAPFISGIFTGPVVILLMTKLQKPWGFFIFGIIPPILLALTGHTWIVPAGSLIFVILAEIILRLGKYKSFSAMMLAHAVFNIWTMMPLFAVILSAKMQASVVKKMGSELVSVIFTLPNIAPIIIIAFIGGIIGAFLGKLMLKKHFQKAGIV